MMDPDGGGYGLYNSRDNRLVTYPLHLRVPGHQRCKFLMSWTFAGVRQHRQNVEQIVAGIKAVGFCRLYQRIDNCAGLRALHRITEQSVRSTYRKGTDSWKTYAI